MSPERLNILAGAVALREFTAPELAAFTGVNVRTVRRVLQQEAHHRSRFGQAMTPTLPDTGGQAKLWRLDDDEAAAILDEIASQEASDSDSTTAASIFSDFAIDPLQRAEFYLTSAEDSVSRSYEAEGPAERLSLAQIALNLVSAADPSASSSAEQGSSHWWQQATTQTGTAAPEELGGDTEFVESIVPIRASARSPLKDLHYDVLRRRAARIVAFANLSARQAQGLAIGSDELMSAAEAISTSSDVLPVQNTLNWVRIFITASAQSGNLPPVAILTRAEREPHDLFPVKRSWRKFDPPVELAPTGYALWIESWAVALWASNLIPGVVVAHDDSDESDKALRVVMTQAESTPATRAVIVASTTTKVDEVAAFVAERGGIFVPVGKSTDALSLTVFRAVQRTLNVLPQPEWPQWEDTAALLGGVNNSVRREIYRITSTLPTQSSDLETVQRALTAFDHVISAYSDPESYEQRDTEAGIAVLVDVLSNLAHRRAVTDALHGAIDFNRNILELPARQGLYYFQVKSHPAGGSVLKKRLQDILLWNSIGVRPANH
jgi:hypothetical protein